MLPLRTRFFVAVEGESEQSFVRWVQTLSDANLHIHLDSFLLGGGGYKTMLENAAREHKRRSKKSGRYKNRFLIVDSDRADQGDCSITQLKRDAHEAGFTAFVQRPNHEGLLLRMLPGMERENLDRASVERRLKSQWETYKKPANAYILARQFSLNDLLRAANFDADLQAFLEAIGLRSRS
ncbi:MAG TPA: hypothetical protein VH280_15290 [Verrucomicrobiae bacterium]|jgi:hypothetical protein|nr:hypothetical protein [Verrucomicrobiae bacterium]